MPSSYSRRTFGINYDSKPKRSFHRRLREQRAMGDAETLAQQMEELRAQMQRLQANRDTQVAAAHRFQEQLNAIPRNAKQYVHPELRVPESVIVLLEIDRTFEIKSHFISLIKRSQFDGKTTDCPMEHINNFIDLCDTIAVDDITLEYVLLKAFKWSLT